MRERIEDLGRIAAMLDRVLKEFELFKECNRPRRCKDYGEWWESLSPDHQDEALHTLVYGIQSVEEELYDILSIAEGTDILNTPEDGQ